MDFSPSAIAEARRKAEGVRGVELREGDVTRLLELGVRGPFDLVLDIGCFHSVPLARRRRYVDGVVRTTRTGARLLLFAFGPVPRRPGSARTREAEVRRRFGAWFELERVILGREPRGAAWFVLRRR